MQIILSREKRLKDIIDILHEENLLKENETFLFKAGLYGQMLSKNLTINELL